MGVDTFIINRQKIEITNETILDCLIEAGYAVDHSCRDGRCKICSVKDLTTGEIVLTCETKALEGRTYCAENIRRIQFPKTQTFPIKFLKFSEHGNFVKITFKYSKAIKLEHLPGQYFDLLFQNFVRSYSIYDVNAELNEFSILIMPNNSGKASKLLTDKDQLGSIFKFKGPKGAFIVEENTSHKKIFICTGTGIAPVINILRNTKLLANQYKVYWGVRQNCSFTKRIQDEFDGVIEIFFSRVKTDNYGSKGRLPFSQIIKSHQSACNWYLCGRHEMILDFENKLRAEDRITEKVLKDPFDV